jgi:dihydrodipicolinate synthase/N-acetylneuraminate lyase
MQNRLRGAIAASVTPLTAGGRTVDVPAVGAIAGFLAAGGIDGALACGTTGEGIMLSVAERRRVAEAFLATRPPGFQMAIHAGAQTTADTVALAGHAMELGADAVAVIAPPYYPLDRDELLRHYASAANAAEPLPFYVYEFAQRSGYAIPPDVVKQLSAKAPNVVGMKVSDRPFEAVEPYLSLGLDVFIGSEPLTLQGLERGAIGAVSALASAFPETVASLVHDRDPGAHDAVVALRDRLMGIPTIAAIKEMLAARGVLIGADVRPPLRGLTASERGDVLGLLRGVTGAPTQRR